MTKKELLARIESLEARVAALEARPYATHNELFSTSEHNGSTISTVDNDMQPHERRDYRLRMRGVL